MKGKRIAKISALLLAMTLVIFMNGCGNSGNTLDEPDKITAEYLYGEYAEQIIRDGGEIISGTVSLESSENDTYNITVNKMVIVESDLTDAGYYIADANDSTTVPLDISARIVYAGDQNSDPEIISVEDFASIVTDSSYDPMKEGSEELYDVYIIGDSAMLILAKELPVINE